MEFGPLYSTSLPSRRRRRRRPAYRSRDHRLKSEREAENPQSQIFSKSFRHFDDKALHLAHLLSTVGIAPSLLPL